MGDPNTTKFTVAREIGAPLLPVKLLHWDISNGRDFADLELRTPEWYPALVLAKKYDGHRDESIFCGNFSDGLPKQAAEGHISSAPFTVVDGPRTRHLFLVHIFGSPGISGAAVVSDETHEILGIVTSGFGFHNLGFGATPISRPEIDYVSHVVVE